MIENYLLEQFVAVAECGTLLGASQKLHISQPSLSRSMHKIEDEFGVALFERSNSKIKLNETGKIAAEYARRALNANQDMISRVVSFDRSLRTVSIGSCTPFPVNLIMPVLQEQLPGKAITTEITDDEHLITGLKNNSYQIAILHQNPDDRDIFCQRFTQENLYISLPEEHSLASKESVTFEDLRGIRILMDGTVGLWKDIVLSKLSASDLLIQNSFDALDELVKASSLSVFNSDQFLSQGYEPEDRISIPISDPEAHITYWLAALTSKQKTYRSVFNTARGRLLKKHDK